MTGIEFLPDDHGAHGPDEELAPGPRRPLPRWLVIVVAAALAVAAVSYAVAQGDNQPTPSVRASSSSQPSRAATIRIPPDDNFGSALAISAGQPVLAVAVSLSNTWVLQSGAVDLVHPNLTAAIPDPPLDVDASATARLLVDPTVNRLWIVVLGDLPGRVLEYEADRVQLVRDIRSISPINAAAALNGHLYLTSGDRLLDVAPGRSPHLAARLPALRAGVVADVDHGRLLANDYGSPSHIWAVTPNAGSTARIGKVVSVNVGKASLGVSGHAIWLAGFDTGRGVLMRLDPTTLRPDLHSTLDPVIEPGAVVVASGSSAIWLRDVGDEGELRCIDPADGRQLQSWLIGGSPASTQHRALVATPTGAVELRLSACPG